MPANISNVLTLADWAKRLDPDGKVPEIVEMLSQTNEVLDDMLFMEGNLPTGHRTTVRSGLPSVYWRKLNAGVAPSKSTTAQIEEACAILEAWSEVDVELANLNGNTSSFRLSEGQAFIEAMNQEMASTVFYGNQGLDPEEFNGLATRYNSSTLEQGENIIKGGSTDPADSSSIYLVCWGANSIHGIFPKGSKAGLAHFDRGEVTVETTAAMGGSRMQAYRDQYQWKTGLALRDWRYVVRIANLDTSADNADLIELMIKAIHRIPSLKMGRCAFYMNRTQFQRLDLLRRNDVIAGGGLVYADVDGKMVPTFRGIPIRKVDALLTTEASVT